MPSSREHHLEEKLIAMVRASTTLMNALRLVQTLQLPAWCIGAGAVRSLVWDSLHQYASPSALDDIDVVHFSTREANIASDVELENALRNASSEHHWEVTNQATVHEWFAQHLGQYVEPLRSLEDGVATWPEYATCVGVYLDKETIGIVAPHGLDDLFGMVVRHNPLRASRETFLQRVEAKQFKQRWPLLRIDIQR